MAFNNISSMGQQRFKCHTCEGPDCLHSDICYNAVTVMFLIIVDKMIELKNIRENNIFFNV